MMSEANEAISVFFKRLKYNSIFVLPEHLPTTEASPHPTAVESGSIRREGGAGCQTQQDFTQQGVCRESCCSAGRRPCG